MNVIADDEIVTDTKLISTGDSTVVGFNMIGESGCGKTSQIKIALDYYPKVIRHTNPDGSKTIQIPYLYIICPPHSNFKELYKTIADELDKYLGNTDHQIRRDICGPTSRKVGEMLTKVIEYIERFAIGRGLAMVPCSIPRGNTRLFEYFFGTGFRRRQQAEAQKKKQASRQARKSAGEK